MKNTLLTTAVLCFALVAMPAFAINEKNQAMLEEHFRNQGDVLYELYAPFGGPELGGAIISTGSGAKLSVVEVQERNECVELYSQSVNPTFKTPPFTLLLTGQHLYVYSTTPWTSPDGIEHQRGDMRIVSLLPENVGKVLYELKDVCDLCIEPGGALTANNLLWQPAPHFLNKFGFLPRKSCYFRIALDFENGEYKIYQLLEALPDAATMDWANLNNRALMNYATYRLNDAAYLLEQANRVAESNQSIIARNQKYVKSELADIGAQQNLMPDHPHLDALESYWQGDYSAVLRALEARQQQGFTSLDYALFGMASAQLKRWAKADEVTIALEHQQFPYMADYLWEMVKIALYQDHPEVAMTYLLAMQVTDTKHQGYSTGMARIERLKGNLAEAEQLLEQYINNPANATYDQSEARLELFDLYRRRGNETGCKRLIDEALKTPITNLQGYVQLVDFIDYTSALVELPVDGSDRIKAPDQPLDSITYQQGISIQ